MTDLEELFRPLIDESAPYREPVATIEARVADRRVRRRRRRRRAQYRFGAGFVAVALIATAVGVVHARGDHGTVRPSRIATTTPPPTTAAPSLAPAGWSTYDYGLARISIPPGWTTAESCPPAGGNALVLAVPGVAARCVHPFDHVVSMRPLEPTDDVHRPYVPDKIVNGIPYVLLIPRCLSNLCGVSVEVPSLKVSISFGHDVDSDSILKTLTYSTDARVFQQPFGAAPASWRTVTFDGFSVRVAADWPTVDLAKTGGFCFPAANTVYVGTPTSAAGCAPLLQVGPPKASLQLESTDVSSPPTESTGWHHNGLRFTRQDGSASTPLSTELFLAVDGPHGRLLVTIGLGLDASVARGILGSLEPTAP